MKSRIVLIIIIYALRSNAQINEAKPKRSDLLTTEKWLQDATTFTFEDPAEREIKRKTRLQRKIDNHPSNNKRWTRRIQRDWLYNSFNGIRIVFEPQVGTLFQIGINKIEPPNLTALGKLGVELNLYKGVVAFQGLLIYPSRVQYDDKSEYRRKGYTVDSLGWVGVDIGFSGGLSFFDGIIAVGFGGIFFDKRDFKNVGIPLVYQNNFFYLNVQVLSAIKVALKGN